MMFIILVIALVISHVEIVLSDSCVCSTTSLNVRTGPSSSYSIVTVLKNKECLPVKGPRSGSWVNVDYNGQSVWLHGGYANLKSVQCKCACATTNVNIRTGAGTWNQRLTTLMQGNCLPYQEATATANGISWSKLLYYSQDAWVASKYVDIEGCHRSLGGGGGGGGSGTCPAIVSRSEWRARKPRSTSRMTVPVSNVFIHHGASPPCYSLSSCSARVRSYQNYHMDTKGWYDIAYSFIVGEDGRVYEGRGWDRVGSHTQGYNSRGIGICVIGNFMNHVPNDAALKAVKDLISCGVKLGKLTSSYRLRGHRDVKSSTSCPGTSFYNLIKTWSHYY